MDTIAAFADPICDFATALASAAGPEERKALFQRTAESYGVARFAYLNIGPRSAPWHLETTYPDAWIEHYIRSNYAETDVVAVEGRRSPVPFHWRTVLDRPGTPEAARRVFEEAAGHGIHDGISIPIHRPEGFASMNLAVTGTDLLRSPADRHALQLLSLYYHDAVEHELVRRWTDGIRLTAREREVLTWTAQGKTSWEVAQILHLAERTVVFHIENAKTKLGASTRSQALVRAVMLGLITP